MNSGVNDLKLIINEQKTYSYKVKDSLNRKYQTDVLKLFAMAEAMQSEVAEIKKELKPMWNWWRGEDAEKYKSDYNLTEELREKLIEEGVDVWKFLNEYFFILGIDTPEKMYTAYMNKHQIINQRLVEEGVVKQE